MVLPLLNNFSLVGGTALSLRYGHRTSVDLDLFSYQKFDKRGMSEALKEAFGPAYLYESDFSGIGLFCYIHDIKIDLVYYPHSLLKEPQVENGIRMYTDNDICAMKIQAILGRGRKKDFWDLAELLQHYSLKQIIDWHQQKYPDQMLLISIPQAISYFTDADTSENPVSLKGQSWEGVKKVIQKSVRNYLK